MGGGLDRIEKQHKSGKLTARERLDLLLDPGSFMELGMFVTAQATSLGGPGKVFYGDGVVTGSDSLGAGGYLCLRRISR